MRLVEMLLYRVAIAFARLDRNVISCADALDPSRR